MKAMIIRTKHQDDLATSYTHVWLQQIINDADSMGWDVIDLTDKAANKQMVEAWIEEFDPKLIIAAGHGFSTHFVGDDGRPIFTAQNVQILKGRTIFLLSCSIGAGIGKKISQIGGCFIGWNIPVTWTTEPGGDPMNDSLAAPIREASISISNTLLKGGSVTDAHNKAIEIFNMWIDTFTDEGIDEWTIQFIKDNRNGLMASCPTGTSQLQEESITPLIIIVIVGIGTWFLLRKKN